MSINTDLADWGEPSATPEDQALVAFLDSLLDKIECGQALDQESLRSQQSVRTVRLLYDCAASIWENSCPNRADDSESPHLYSTLGTPNTVPPKSLNREDKMEMTPLAIVPNMADPFPGEFRITRLLGEGAFGKVWLADDLKLGRQVALKTLKLPATSTLGPEVLTALRTEAQHLAKLDHPNIVRVHAWRESGGEFFLVLQFVSGGSLADRLKKEKALSWQDATRYIVDVGEALVESHICGVIHRDVKPENILWDADKDEVLLTDFGISARLAEPGDMAGTPIYMAPEAFGGHVSPALDSYSLAATLYCLVTGKLPFRQRTVPDLILEKLQGLPDPDPNLTGIPEPLERLIRGGLLAEPGERPKLAAFVLALRGTLNQLLADDLAAAEDVGRAPAKIQLVVSRRLEGGTYQRVATTNPKSSGLSRDMKKVPRPPDSITLRTGDQVRIEVTTSHDGYLTVFNVGPTGNLNLLYPEEIPAEGSLPNVQANRSVHVMDVVMEPPIGHERLFAVWSRKRLPVRLEDLRCLAEQDRIPTSQPYQSSRDMKRLQKSVSQLRPEEWGAVVLELIHSA